MKNALAEEFLELLLGSGALTFGDFLTKSGRRTPYFFNTGYFDHGALLTRVAKVYSDLIRQRFPNGGWHLYGPAYKGIPLCTSVAQALAQSTNTVVPFTFNRKEVKDHGE